MDKRSSDLDLKTADALARLMDDHFVDPALGFLLPGLGDFLGSVIGLVIVGIAWRRRLARAVIARMLMNLAVDAAVGAIPVLGDGFDLIFQANRRNANLLRTRVAEGDSPADAWVLAGAAALFLLALALPIMVGIWVATLLIQAARN